MKCGKCQEEFEEKKLELSHDVPKYVGGTDLDGRQWLCKKHHNDYEILILSRCLEFVGEKYIEEDKILWMKELSKQPENLKEHFKIIAKKVKEEFFEDG